jgi:hypothetical protein
MQDEGKDVKRAIGTRSIEMAKSVYSFFKKRSNSDSVISAKEIPKLVFEATDVPLNIPK